MPKKSKGGNKYKRKKASTDQNEKLNMVFKEEGEEYAIVEKMVGGGRCYINLPDKSVKLAIIRGKLRRRKTWISNGDLVLVAIRSFQDDKCDVIHKYTQGQVQILKKKNVLPPGFLNTPANETSGQNNNQTLSTNYCTFEFRDDESDYESDNEKEINDNISKNDKINVISDENESEDVNNSKDDAFEFDFDDI